MIRPSMTRPSSSGSGVANTVRVGAFLVRHPNEHFCHDCLAVRLGASVGNVRRAIARLSTEIVLDRTNARCADCARKRSAIGFVAPR